MFRTAPGMQLPQLLHTDTRLIIYNDEVFIPYQSGGWAEVDEVPYEYAVMKMKTDGKDLVTMIEPRGGDVPRYVHLESPDLFYGYE